VAAVKSGDLTTVKLSFHAVKDDLTICEQAPQDAAIADHADIVEFLDQKIPFNAKTLDKILQLAIKRNGLAVVEYVLVKKPDSVESALKYAITQRRPKTLNLLLNQYAQSILTSSLENIAASILKTSSPAIKKEIAKLLTERKTEEQAQANTGADTKTSSSASSTSSTSSSSSSSSSSAAARNTVSIKYSKKDFLAAVTDGGLEAVKLSFHAVKDKFETCKKAFQDAAFAGHLGIVKFLDQNISFEPAALQQKTLRSVFTEAARMGRIDVVRYFLDKKDPEIDSSGIGFAFENAAGQQRSRIVDLFLDNPEYETRISALHLESAQEQAKSTKMKNKIAKHLAIRNAKEQTQTSTGTDTKTPSSSSSTSSASSSSSSSSSNEKNFLDAATAGNYDTIKSIIDAASHESTHHTVGQALLFSIVHNHEKVSELLLNHNATKATAKIATADYEKTFCMASRLARNNVVKLFLRYHANGTIKIADFWLLKAHSITPDPALRRVIFSQLVPQTGNVASTSPAANTSLLDILANATVASTAPPSNSTNAKK